MIIRIIAAMLAITATPLANAAEKLNVLFIVADDLRPELGCYGSHTLTPNIDALAARGVRFERAYCQQTVCNPSRSSFLTGKRPDHTHIWNNSVHFRDRNPDVITLPQLFKDNGYVTRDVGKIFHNWHTAVKGDRRSWSDDEFLHYANHGEDTPKVDEPLPENLAFKVDRAYGKQPLCEKRDVPDEAYYDGRVANEAVRVLGEIKDKPFFLAVGFWKPHAPMNAPKPYWDLYNAMKLPTLDPSKPANAPEIAFHESTEVRGAKRTFTPAEAAEVRHGYYANTSYMDRQLGKVLKALNAHHLAEKTIIVFFADHGYHLGEHDLWGKTSVFELDARVPLVVVPPKSANAGRVTEALAELVDLYPTLAEMCGLLKPAGLDGVSLAPVIADTTKTVKPAAFTQHPRPAYYDRTKEGVPEAMGYSVRTDKVRYTEWRDWQTGKVVARELYEHTRDPGEMRNTVESPGDAEALKEAVKLLNEQVPPDVAPSKR
jgi:iduronate 2-sulfatase